MLRKIRGIRSDQVLKPARGKVVGMIRPKERVFFVYRDDSGVSGLKY